MKFKAEPLDLLKVIVHQEDLGEDGAATAANNLCTVHLRNTHMQAWTCTHIWTQTNTKLAVGLWDSDVLKDSRDDFSHSKIKGSSK